MLRSDVCDYSDAYVVVKGDITPEGDNNANKRNKNIAFIKKHHLSTALQKSTAYRLTMQKT